MVGNTVERGTSGEDSLHRSVEAMTDVADPEWLLLSGIPTSFLFSQRRRTTSVKRFVIKVLEPIPKPVPGKVSARDQKPGLSPNQPVHPPKAEESLDINKQEYVKMLYVLYKNSGVHSGRALRKELARAHHGPVVGGFPKRFKQIIRRRGEPEFVINLGTTESFNISSRFLNHRDMVRASSNKKQARRIFAEEGIPAPRLFLRASEIGQSDLPVVGRTSYHKKGQGFWFCKTLSDVRRAVQQGATHFLEFVPNTREYRVHTFAKDIESKEERGVRDYASIKISEKVWQGQGKPNPNSPQKNHTFGWTFLGPQDRREEELDVVRHAAKQAIASLGMDFGAVDVMYRVKTKTPYVLEVNSTPSLANEVADTCSRYAQRILKTLGKLEE
ncbi:MAG: hypothetical protein GF334_03675 [Candidatus Altiarchaeales archaeon]|nr:hypothetical protein [Candidatus Altiarchaeales archaeon]